MEIKCSAERNIQILIEVLKANNIRKIVASPGTTNFSFVACVQSDEFFEVYSAVDERGAAYIACGLAAESGEPVVITCTGATASRNYFPALTEAYHKKLPILAVTGSQELANSGHLIAQFIDRTEHPSDAVKLSVQVQIVRNENDEWDCTYKINKAVLELYRNGGGPVHVNLASSYSNDFEAKEVKPVRIIRRHYTRKTFPQIDKNKRIAITVGAHKRWTKELTVAVDLFCERYDAVVLVDHSSAYWGKFRVLPTILATQERHYTDLFDIDLLIHIGEEHGDYYTNGALSRCKEVWRVSEDGEIRDTFRKLSNVFQMSELEFFNAYSQSQGEMAERTVVYYERFQKELRETYELLPELPFSNIWVAEYAMKRFPKDAAMHLGVSNTMRSWTFFDFPQDTYVMANTGCRGIDGAIATALGMSLVNPKKLHFAVMGDLTFFYGLNVLGNRHIGNNLRIMLINNGCGAEFNLYPHRVYKAFDGEKEAINQFAAGGGHYASKSKDVVKHFSEDLGFMYLRAESKEEFMQNCDLFLSDEIGDKPMIFEVFTDTENENEALKIIRSLRVDTASVVKQKVAEILGEKGVAAIRKIIK